MAWFKRKEKGINTPTEAKKDTPKGLWYKTPSGKIIDTEELKRNLYVSPEDGYHVKIGSKEYFEMLFDDNKFKEMAGFSKEYLTINSINDDAKFDANSIKMLYRNNSIQFKTNFPS